MLKKKKDHQVSQLEPDFRDVMPPDARHRRGSLIEFHPSPSQIKMCWFQGLIGIGGGCRLIRKVPNFRFRV